MNDTRRNSLNPPTTPSNPKRAILKPYGTPNRIISCFLPSSILPSYPSQEAQPTSLLLLIIPNRHHIPLKPLHISLPPSHIRHPWPIQKVQSEIRELELELNQTKQDYHNNAITRNSTHSTTYLNPINGVVGWWGSEAVTSKSAHLHL
jgi:hypothetical protein